MPNTYPYQVEGVDALQVFLTKHMGALLADDMGLGKTAQALELINRTQPMHVLVVCPSSVKINWLRECDLWLDHDYTYHLISGRGVKTFTPDFPLVSVINYDLIHHTDFKDCEYDLIIFDEAHYMKNPKAKRTKSCMKIRTEKRLLLTGTPIVNRPKELWQLLLLCDVVDKGAYRRFAVKYCASFKEWIYIPGGNGKRKQVWNDDGSSNLEELSYWLRQLCMVRRLKKDVLTDLPEKTRQIIELPWAGGKPDYLRDEYTRAVAKMKDDTQVAFEEISLLRHETALEKLPQVIDFISYALQSSDKIVVFAHHRDVIEELMMQFTNIATHLVGGMTAEQKQESVNIFKEKDHIRLFFGQIQAAGTGVNGLQEVCDHAIFVELPWSPSELSQAEDRLHRIGQTGNVLVQHLVFENSLDCKIAKTLVRKQKLIDTAVDADVGVDWVQEITT